VECKEDALGRTPLQLAMQEGATSQILNVLQDSFFEANGESSHQNGVSNSPARPREGSASPKTFVLSDPVMMEHISMAKSEKTLECSDRLQARSDFFVAFFSMTGAIHCWLGDASPFGRCSLTQSKEGFVVV